MLQARRNSGIQPLFDAVVQQPLWLCLAAPSSPVLPPTPPMPLNLSPTDACHQRRVETSTSTLRAGLPGRGCRLHFGVLGTFVRRHRHPERRAEGLHVHTFRFSAPSFLLAANWDDGSLWPPPSLCRHALAVALSSLSLCSNAVTAVAFDRAAEFIATRRRRRYSATHLPFRALPRSPWRRRTYVHLRLACWDHRNCERVWKESWWPLVGKKILHPDKPMKLSDLGDHVRKLSLPGMKFKCQEDAVTALKTNTWEYSAVEEGAVKGVLDYHKL
ncbi:hypothetical protein B0H16DRAFT_1552724 [Mycena metata]|uniref:Uncharacterized protein n=1 Tax=Mycena metata TaxID=1033252 RepID=A0AAD7IQY3_9AGAR|nr:hypothetical protein B0H16DRAFT_1552724 [Mycena metata]